MRGVSIQQTPFGVLPTGEPVSLFTFENKNGVLLSVTDFGGKMVRLLVPDREGRREDVILGFDTLEPYLIRNPYFGTLVGRCANRIRNASFCLNGKTYHLDANSGPHHLHGGAGGFDKRLWEAAVVERDGAEQLRLQLHSPDGDQGYPGNLTVTVYYALDDDNRVSLEYFAQADADTIVNMTNHCYFNLNGHKGADVRNHVLTIRSDAITDLDDEKMVNGDILPVEGTPFDFRTPHLIGERIGSDHRLTALTGGYDINYVLRRDTAGDLEPVCTAAVPENGRSLTVYTTLPAMQLYTANYIRDSFTFVGKDGAAYDHPYCGLCLETQHYPNSPNCPQFPSVVLRRGDTYHTKTVYRFGEAAPL